jgi:hypothetical protein
MLDTFSTLPNHPIPIALSRGGYRRGERDPRHAGRGDDGDDVEGGSLRAGRRDGHESHG